MDKCASRVKINTGPDILQHQSRTIHKIKSHRWRNEIPTWESKQVRSDHRLTIIEYKMEYHSASHNKRIITLVHDQFWEHYIEEISKSPNINNQMTTKEKYNLIERHIKISGKKVIEHKNVKIGCKSAVRGYNNEIK